MGFKICAGKVSDLRQDSGDWLFVDVGFSSKGKTCGVLKGAGNPELRTFRGMVDLVLQEVQVTGQPLNLLLEAPLSAAFNQSRNPTGRSIESIDGKNARTASIDIGTRDLQGTWSLHPAIYCARCSTVRFNAR